VSIWADSLPTVLPLAVMMLGAELSQPAAPPIGGLDDFNQRGATICLCSFNVLFSFMKKPCAPILRGRQGDFAVNTVYCALSATVTQPIVYSAMKYPACVSLHRWSPQGKSPKRVCSLSGNGLVPPYRVKSGIQWQGHEFAILYVRRITVAGYR
jgi:hypothetical protein